MKIELLYGHEGIVVDVPDDISVTSIHKNTMTPLDDPSKAVEQALESPVGSASISVIAQGKKRHASSSVMLPGPSLTPHCFLHWLISSPWPGLQRKISLFWWPQAFTAPTRVRN